MSVASALSPRTNTRALSEIIGLLRRHRTLTIELTRRDIGERYAGQVLGSAWAIGHPLALMTIYVFVFAFVFKLDVTSQPGMTLDYTTYLLSGLIPWMAFQESMARGAVAVTGQANLVKQVVFPIEVLPIRGVLVSLVPQLVSTALLLIYVLVSAGTVQWTYVLLPVLIGFQALAMAGVSLFISSVGVYFRDLKDFVQVFSIACMYLMPVFYTPLNVPALFKPVLFLNPFSHLIWCAQDVSYFGEIRHPLSWFVFPAFAVLAFCFGYRTFRRLKAMFGNVL